VIRALARRIGPDLIRDVGALAVGILIVGVAFGAIAAAEGLPWWESAAMSALVFAGASQFATLGIMTSGGGLLAGVAAGLVLNLRHIPYGLAIGDLYWRGWRSRLLGSHLLIDQSTAFALAAGEDRRRARVAFWTVGVALFIAWNTGTVIGALAGQFVADPAVLGLDAALPAILLALVLPSLRDKETVAAAGVGSAVALGTSLFLPAGLPVLLALVGLAVLWRGGKRKEAAA
jgi:4-azaleucine resistance transporter AzlC